MNALPLLDAESNQIITDITQKGIRCAGARTWTSACPTCRMVKSVICLTACDRSAWHPRLNYEPTS